MVRFLLVLQKVVIDGVDGGEAQIINMGLGLGLGSYRVGLPNELLEKLSHIYNFLADSPTPACCSWFSISFDHKACSPSFHRH